MSSLSSTIKIVGISVRFYRSFHDRLTRPYRQETHTYLPIGAEL